MDGEAVTLDPVVPLSPMDGFHAYVLAPDAVSVVDVPEQKFDEPAEAITFGLDNKVMATVDVAVQPLAAVPVTV